jgi:hypothetical protein
MLAEGLLNRAALQKNIEQLHARLKIVAPAQ